MSEKFVGDPPAQNLTREQARVIEEVYGRLVQQGNWPTYEEVDHDADRQGIEDPLTVMKSLAPSLLRGISGGPALNQEVSLSLAGVAAAANWNSVAAEDLALFAKSVQAAVAVADNTRPPASATFDCLAFLNSMHRNGVPVEPAIRLGRLWSAAGADLWHGLGGVGTAEWRATLNRQSIRRYRQVRDVNTLLEVERSRLATVHPVATVIRGDAVIGPQPTTGAPNLAQTPLIPDPEPAWVALLPTGFREAVAPKVGHSAADAINAGWIALADLIHERVGLDLDGEDLVNQAFGGKQPRVRLSPETKTGDNLHQAYTHMMRALARIRNAQSHRGRPQVSDLHAAATILAMADCFEVVGRLGPPPTTT